MKKSIHYPLVLVIIAAACVAGIDVVYKSVAERIREADEKKARGAVSVIFKDVPSDQIEKIESTYEGDTVTWFKCPAGYAVIAGAQGFDGEVKLMAGWDTELKELIGIFVLSHTETPGLGANVDMVESANTWYLLLFNTGEYMETKKKELGKRPKFQDAFKNRTIEEAKLKRDGGQVDAMVGATITSVAVVNAVSKSREILQAILSGEDEKSE